MKDLLFKYTEVIPILFLLYFRSIFSYPFLGFYLAFLLVFLTIKLHICKGIQNRPEPILSFSLMLMEISLVFLKYSLDYLGILYPALIISMLLFILISIFLCKYNLTFICSLVLRYGGFVTLFVGLGLSIISSRRHDCIEIFKISNELLLMNLIVNLGKPKYRSINKISNIFLKAMIIFSPIIPILALLLINHELGTIMVVIITDIFSLLLFSVIKKRKALLISLIISIASIIGIWIIFYRSPSKQVLLKTTLNNLTGHDFSNQLNRIFIRYKASDQLKLTNDIAFGFLFDESKSKTEILIDMFTRFFSPTEYREIVSNETDSFTSSADYAFSLLTYTNPIFSISLAVSSAVVYSNALIHSYLKKHSTYVIPLSLLVTHLIHIGGGLLVFPFTGIPLPLLSYGKSSLGCTVFVLVLFSFSENNNSNIANFE